jgi:hypothetical protein
MAKSNGAKPESIRRYKELYTIGGYNAAMVQIKYENWFRRNWYRRQQLPREMQSVVKDLE